MILKPQDVVIALKLTTIGKSDWSYCRLAKDLFMSVSETHAGVRRAVAARLLDPQTRAPLKQPLEEFLVHGAKYAYPPDRGGLTRGVPTGHAAPPLSDLVSHDREMPPVWPDPDGSTRGYEFSPLYRSVPLAAKRDAKLYELLALVDALRGGQARERMLAERELKTRLRS